MAKKKGKKKRRTAPEGFDPNERRRERLEARRREREEAARRARRRAQRERLVRLATFAALFALAVWFVFLRTATPEAIAGHDVESGSSTGSGDHSQDPVAYDRTPPVSGPHAPTASPCGTYSEQLPDEQMVHMLEHGAVGILFRPDLDPTSISIIEAIVEDYPSDTFSEPYADLDTPIELVSWGESMPLPELDAEAIHRYIAEFGDDAPEAGEPCPHGSSQSAVPQEPAPSPSPSPTGDAGGNGGGDGNGGGGGGNDGGGGGGGGGGTGDGGGKRAGKGGTGGTGGGGG
ncbi:MAG TPA: DUF3105 domain-containing protein [Actinomycetota bacterium]|nr:DUF3105 domain-containing protein [Actinomycetota bacterium]